MSASSPFLPWDSALVCLQDVSSVLFDGPNSVNGTLSRCSLGRYGLDASNIPFLPVDVGCPQNLT